MLICPSVRPSIHPYVCHPEPIIICLVSPKTFCSILYLKYIFELNFDSILRVKWSGSDIFNQFNQEDLYIYIKTWLYLTQSEATFKM